MMSAVIASISSVLKDPHETTHAPLAAALASVPFVNEGKVSRADVFRYQPIPAMYLEPEAPTRARWAWADGREHQYLFGAANATPPLGMRSAPPLGGLAAGTVELRADGSLQAWTIENASPAGSTKLAVLDDALLGVRLAAGSWAEAVALRTAPPAGIPGVEEIGFAGTQPFVRLTPRGAGLPEGLDLRLYGRSPWRVGDLDASSTPALALTLVATNPTELP